MQIECLGTNGKSIELKVDADFILGGLYEDENDVKYICTHKMATQKEPLSTLRAIQSDLGETFSTPTKIEFVARPTSK